MSKAIMWLRRDMRLEDNMALSVATRNHDEVYPVFIFDTNILDKLKNKKDQRVSLIFDRLKELNKKHKVHIFYGDPVALIPQIADAFGAQSVYANEDYESYALSRDGAIAKKVELKLYKDHVVFRYDEIKNKQGLPYKVFTPYKNVWLYQLETNPESYAEKKVDKKKLCTSIALVKKEVNLLSDIGFDNAPYGEENKKFDINTYKKHRDFPAVDGTSRLSAKLRFGIVCPRQLIRKNMPFNNIESQTWLSELVWRDFYFAVLGNFPHVEKKCFIKEFDKIKWDNDKKLFKAWCEGKTGVPIVDAGMRELNTTGWMHNRVRMIVASYLCKTLLIDWRWGESYFAEKLIDFDLAANNGGWQWSASTGCDAAPYFRIFNPYSQGEKFDPDAIYIKKYVPELSKYTPKEIHKLMLKSEDYNSPVIDYKAQRAKALAMYKKAKE